MDILGFNLGSLLSASEARCGLLFPPLVDVDALLVLILGEAVAFALAVPFEEEPFVLADEVVLDDEDEDDEEVEEDEKDEVDAVSLALTLAELLPLLPLIALARLTWSLLPVAEDVESVGGVAIVFVRVEDWFVLEVVECDALTLLAGREGSPSLDLSSLIVSFHSIPLFLFSEIFRPFVVLMMVLMMMIIVANKCPRHKEKEKWVRQSVGRRE